MAPVASRFALRECARTSVVACAHTTRSIGFALRVAISSSVRKSLSAFTAATSLENGDSGRSLSAHHSNQPSPRRFLRCDKSADANSFALRRAFASTVSPGTTFTPEILTALHEHIARYAHSCATHLDAVCVPPLLGVGISGPTTSLATRGRVMLRRRAEPFGCLNAIMAPVRLSSGKGNVDRCAPARLSMQRKARMLHIGSFHALSSHEWRASHSSLSSCQSVRRLSCGKGNC